MEKHHILVEDRDPSILGPIETNLSPPGPDSGVDILASSGSLGLGRPRLFIQVKSRRHLTLPSSGVFRAPCPPSRPPGPSGELGVFHPGRYLGVQAELLLGSALGLRRLGGGVLRNYESLPEELQNELPLKRIWALVPE